MKDVRMGFVWRIKDYFSKRIPVMETEPLCSAACDGCGSVYHKIPEHARFGGFDRLRGFYFECTCSSTLFVHESKAS